MKRCIQCGHTVETTTPECVCCGTFPHCFKCEQPEVDCVCCACHSEFPCPGDSATGSVPPQMKPPWEKRGDKLVPNTKYPTWQTAWPTLAHAHKNLDVCREAADFYLLDAMRHAVLNREHECSGVCHHTEFWQDDLREVKREAQGWFFVKTRHLDVVLQQYVEMACGGEARHHKGCGGYALSQHRRTAWADWKWIHDQLGHQALLDGIELFSQFPGGAFGGAKWGNALRLLYNRQTGKISDVTYVDQVWTLVHNGGVFLNKLDWAVKNKIGWDLSALQTKLLPAQQADNWKTLLRLATPDISKLWDTYWRTSNRARINGAMHPTVNLRRVTRRLTVCAHCGSDPKRGHLMQCRRFLTGKLKTDGYEPRIFEDEEIDQYSMHRYTIAEYPVGPHGEIRMVKEAMYLLVVETHSDAGCKVRRWAMNGQQLMTHTVKFARNTPKFEGWEEDKYWFTVRLFDPSETAVLGSFTSEPMYSRKLFVTKELVCGAVLPMLLPDIEWNGVTNAV